jgi:hypothetical protein
VIELNDSVLVDLGLGSLNAGQRRRILEQLYSVLELRVGSRLAKTLSDRQLDEFGELIPDQRAFDDGRTIAAQEWLLNQFPEHRLVVQREFQYMCDFIRERVAAATDVSGRTSTRKGERDLSDG